MKTKALNLLGLLLVFSLMVMNTASAQPASHISAGSSIKVPDGITLPNYNVRSDGTVDVMLELYDAPTTVVYASTLANRHNQMQASIDTRTSYSTILSAQSSVKAELSRLSPDTTVLYSVQRAYNGIAVKAKTTELGNLSRLIGVKAVHILHPDVIDNSYSVPMIGAPAVWQMGLGNRGTGIRVGDIDTGLDYIHTNFGGPGTNEAYAANDTTTVGDVPYYPSAKVAGGYDFAGDAYNPASSNPAINTPHPDPDPMDCNGHGSHTAGTIAGYGVNGNGTTYKGVYGAGTDFADMRIGPGVAPDATLYALRVFGCSGATNLVPEAIDWAVDPNGDGDPSDHLDVINMSLGSPYGTDYSADSVASDNASLAGMIVAAASGNDSDTQYITSEPGVATRAISVAASTNPQSIMDGFTVNVPTPVTNYGSLNALNGWTSITSRTGDLKYYAANPGACTALPAGTFTGKIALVDWTFLSDNITNACGSSTRVSNAAAAGAVGVLIDYQHPVLDITISGNAAAPSTITTLATGNLLKTELGSGTVNVTLTTTLDGSIKNVDPSIKDITAGFSSRGPRSGDSFLKPDITAPGLTVFSTKALSGNLGTAEEGTSMATPHIAGVMALLREMHPTWTVEELKALAMNTATHDLTTLGAGIGATFATPRIGAGRVDAANAADDSVIAYNSDDSGAVSVSFGDVQVPADNSVFDISKHVVVTNKAGSVGHAATYGVAFVPDSSLATAGVSFAVEDAAGKAVTSITLDPGKSTILTVHLLADGTKMKHPLDKTMSKVEVANNREYMSEAGGYLTLTPTAGAVQLLRVPVYAVTEPVSKMNAVPNLVLPGASGKVDLALKGVGIDTGNVTPVDVKSLVSAFELKAMNPDLKLTDPRMVPGNFQYVGITSDRPAEANMANSFIFAGFSTYGKWNSPNLYEFDVWISTTGDGVPDFVAYTTSLPNGASSSDVYTVNLVNLNTSSICDIEVPNWVDGETLDTAILNNNVMVMPIAAGCLGLTDVNSKITFGMVSWSNETGQMIDHSGVTLDKDGNIDTVDLPFDVKNLALDLTGGSVGAPIYNDMPTDTIPVTYNKANIQGKLMGLLLLHHMNAAGNTAEVVSLLYNQSYLPIVRH